MDKPELDILVVDDQSGVRSLLLTALGDLGYSVGVACNGNEGVEMALELKPHLVIMDIKMPVKDGITALYQIKEEQPQIKVIMMTAYGDAEAIAKIKNGGAVGCIFKPFDIDYLIEYVDDLLSTKRPFQAYA